MKAEKYSYCTSKEFKKDISKLCEACPLIELINNGIESQILEEALEQKEILTESQFKEYVEKEILNAQEAMKNTTSNHQKLVFVNINGDMLFMLSTI